MTPERVNGSTTMATVIDQEVQRILNEGYAMARAILNEHYNQLVRLADALMEYEQLGRAQFEALLRQDSNALTCCCKHDLITKYYLQFTSKNTIIYSKQKEFCKE